MKNPTGGQPGMIEPAGGRIAFLVFADRHSSDELFSELRKCFRRRREFDVRFRATRSNERSQIGGGEVSMFDRTRNDIAIWNRRAGLMFASPRFQRTDFARGSRTSSVIGDPFVRCHPRSRFFLCADFAPDFFQREEREALRRTEFRGNVIVLI